MPVQVKDPTDIQSAYDDRADPALKSAEDRGSDAAYTTSGIDQLEAYANDPANSVKNAEEADGGGWNVNRSEGGAKQKNRGDLVKKLLTRGGPTGGIVGLLIAGMMAIGSVFPTLLPLHIKEAALKAFDNRSVTSTVRTDRIFAAKLVGDTTTGSCNIVKVMCRYQRPSNRFLKNLETHGITAFDKSGNILKTNAAWPNGKPAYLEFTHSGTTEPERVLAKDLTTKLRDDIEFRKAFRSAYNSRFNNFIDSVYLKVLKRFSASKADVMADTADETSAREKLNAASEGENVAERVVAKEGEEGAEDLVTKLARDKLADVMRNLGKASKVDSTQLIAGVACIAADVPSILSSVIRGYQVVQLARYALVFLVVADKIKAGDATSAEVSALGAILTTTYKDGAGKVANRSAMESFGMKYMLFGDTNTSNQTKGHDYKKFSPGGSYVASLSNATKYTDTEMKKNACAVATNPFIGLGVKAAVASTGVGLIPVLIESVVALGVGMAFEAGAESIASALAPHLSAAAKGALPYLLGDLTQGLEGEDVGNGFASGAALTLSQNANAGGNVPMSIEDASAFREVSQQVNVAYAEEDRLDANPLDASNPNTFLGSIVGKFLPYASQMTSVTSIFSSISSISLGSLGNLFSPTTRAYSDKDYTLCTDNLINDGSIAVGPFCNIIYGVPTEYLNLDPVVVAQYMVDSKQVNEETGEVTADSEYDFWISNCLGSETAGAKNCKINDEGMDESSRQKVAYFSIYTVDHQIQKSMDGEDEVESATTAVESYGKCPATTTHGYGTQKGYDNGKQVDIVTCGIVDWPANFANSAGEKIVEVNSEIAADTVKLAQALKAKGYNYTASIGFRTNEQQACIYQQYITKKKGCSPFNSVPPNAASAGYSNHQMGYSIDMSGTRGTGVGNWLDSHMSEYGFSRDVSGDYGHMTNKP